jgi:transcriptional regulator with XRE-family HTH domain
MVRAVMRKLRLSLGLSQRRLGVRADLSESQVSKIENGWLLPYPGQARRLARALGVPVEELFPAEQEELFPPR